IRTRTFIRPPSAVVQTVEARLVRANATHCKVDTIPQIVVRQTAPIFAGEQRVTCYDRPAGRPAEPTTTPIDLPRNGEFAWGGQVLYSPEKPTNKRERARPMAPAR